MIKEKNIDELMLIRYFAEELTDVEITAVEGWITESEQNKKMAKEVFSIYNSIKALQQHSRIDTEAALKKVKKRMAVQRNDHAAGQGWSASRFSAKLQRVAAIMTIPLLILTAYMWIERQTEEQGQFIEVRSASGAVTTLTLPDSSKVWLNSNSYIKYPTKFSRKSRDIELVGEAYFDVAREEKRAFRVATPNDVVVNVLGTSFNVEAYKNVNAISATLISGSIELEYLDERHNNRSVVLSPNEKAIYSLDKMRVVTKSANIAKDIAWRDGKLMFDHTTFEEAIQELENRYSVKFVVNNPKLYDLSFTGTFKHQTLEEILKAFELASGVKYRYKNPEDSGETMMEIEIH